MPTLKEKLEEHKKKFLTMVTDEMLTIVGAAGKALAETVPSRKTPKAGDKLPAFSLIGSEAVSYTHLTLPTICSV